MQLTDKVLFLLLLNDVLELLSELIDNLFSVRANDILDDNAEGGTK